MATEHPGKDVSEQASATENTKTEELNETDLKSVTGGLSNSFGGSVNTNSTAVCISD